MNIMVEEIQNEITFEYLKKCAKRAAGAVSFVNGITAERISNQFNKIQDCTFFRLACLYRCYNNGEKSQKDKIRVLALQDNIQSAYEKNMERI